MVQVELGLHDLPSLPIRRAWSHYAETAGQPHRMAGKRTDREPVEEPAQAVARQADRPDTKNVRTEPLG